MKLFFRFWKGLKWIRITCWIEASYYSVHSLNSSYYLPPCPVEAIRKEWPHNAMRQACRASSSGSSGRSRRLALRAVRRKWRVFSKLRSLILHFNWHRSLRQRGHSTAWNILLDFTEWNFAEGPLSCDIIVVKICISAAKQKWQKATRR